MSDLADTERQHASRPTQAVRARSFSGQAAGSIGRLLNERPAVVAQRAIAALLNRRSHPDAAPVPEAETTGQAEWPRASSLTPARAAGRTTSIAQRKIVVAGAKVSREEIDLNMVVDARSRRLLRPVYEKRLKGPAVFPEGGAASYDALRSALVRELVDGWRGGLTARLPTLAKLLPERQFNTLIFMTYLADGFEPLPLEKALTAAGASKSIDQGTLDTLFSPGILPPNDVGYGIFAADWSAQVPGITGVIAELQTALSIRPDEMRKGQQVSLGRDMYLGGKTIGGQTTQDADVSFVNLAGRQVLVEVAATVDRLNTKMGVAGQMQRKRYERLVEVDRNRVLAYSTPGAHWAEFFTGDDSIAERAALLDGVGWGLVIDGHYTDPQELLRTSAVVTGAEPFVSGFREALVASGLRYDDVAVMTADQLQKRLQRHARH